MLRQPAHLFLLLLTACASTPPLAGNPEDRIANAEQALREDRPADAAALVEPLVESKSLTRRLRERRDLVRATANLMLGLPWDAFELCRAFPEQYPHSPLRTSIAEVEYQCGRALERRGGGFLFFSDDRSAARTCLQHLITRHPDHVRVPDALRLLGDMAFEDGEYEMAQERYRDLMRRYPDSEWVVHARFRYAMSLAADLQGPDYDLDQMELASRELRDFLATSPENPVLVGEATAALARLREWRAERHLHIAAFYERIGNAPGRRLHLEFAGKGDLAGTKAATRAESLLRRLDGSEPSDAEVGGGS